MYMTVFYVVFGLLLKRGGGPEFIPFLLCGLTVWKWFDSSIRQGSVSIQKNAKLMDQVYIPKILFPIISLGQTTFKFIVVFVLLLIFLHFFTVGSGITYLAIPVLLITQLLLMAAISMLLAAWVPFLPDINKLVTIGMMPMMFLSGVFFSGNKIPIEYRDYFFLNPMATLIEEYRNVLLFERWPDWSGLAVIAAFSITAITIAVKIIHHHDKNYPKVL